MQRQQNRPPPPAAQSAAASARQNEYFVPRDGIDREVITSDICRYLGNDALVRPGTYEVGPLHRVLTVACAPLTDFTHRRKMAVSRRATSSQPTET